MCLYVIFSLLSRSHLVNQCITTLLARCSNIAEFSDLSWYFARRPPSCVWVSPSTQARQFGLMGSDTTVFHFAWILRSLPFTFVTIYHFLKSAAQNLSPSSTLTRKGSLLNTYIQGLLSINVSWNLATCAGEKQLCQQTCFENSCRKFAFCPSFWHRLPF